MSSRKKPDPFAKKKKSSSLINFLSLVVGFTLMSITILMAYNYFFGNPEVSSTNVDSGDADESVQVPVEKVILADGLSFDKFAKEVAISEASDLAAYLERTNTLGYSDERVPARIERNRRRVKAAEQLLMYDCTDEEYLLAIRSKLLGLSSIYNTSLNSGFQVEVSEDADELKKFAQSLDLVEDETIRLDARLTIVGIDLIESAKSQAAEATVEQNANLILKLLKDFPEETKVASYLQMIFPPILEINAVYALQLTEKLMPYGKEFKQQHQAQLFRNFYDLAKLTSSSVKQKLETVFVGGEEAKRELMAIAKEFASDASGGELMINELELLMHWMEQEKEYPAAVEIHQLLIESAPARATPELTRLAEKTGRDGQKRCGSVGKVLELRGERLAGGQLNAEQFDRHFVVVMFITFEKLNAEALLNEIEGELANLANRRVKFIAVTLDKNPDSSFNTFVDRYPNIEFLKCGGEDEQLPTILMQFPAHIVPQAILLDPDGVLIRSGIRLRELNLVVNEELIKRENR